MAKHLETADVEPAAVAHVTVVVGKGMEGMCGRRTMRIGNARWLRNTISTVCTIPYPRISVLCATSHDQLGAVFGLEATLRDDVTTVVDKLVERDIAVSVISDDEISCSTKGGPQAWDFSRTHPGCARPERSSNA